jgi:hypothetical protein
MRKKSIEAGIRECWRVNATKYISSRHQYFRKSLFVTCDGLWRLVASQKSRQVKSRQVRLIFQKVGLMDALAV